MRETKLSLYADNLILYIRNPYQSLLYLSDLMGIFGNLSGYKISQSKSEMMGIRVLSDMRKKILDTYPVQWKDKFQYLGTVFSKVSKELCQDNVDLLIKQMGSPILA